MFRGGDGSAVMVSRRCPWGCAYQGDSFPAFNFPSFFLPFFPTGFGSSLVQLHEALTGECNALASQFEQSRRLNLPRGWLCTIGSATADTPEALEQAWREGFECGTQNLAEPICAELVKIGAAERMS